MLGQLLELVCGSTGADDAELVLEREGELTLVTSWPEHRTIMATDASMTAELVLDASQDDRTQAWVQSCVVVPVTGPSGEAGWLAVGSERRNGVSVKSQHFVEVAVGLVESEFDRSLEQDRLDELGAVLVANERHLEATRRRLEDSNEELEQFAYIAAHELVAPLRTVALYSELLERLVDEAEPGSIETSRECVTEIRSGVRLMSERVQDLMELSKTQSEPTTTKPTDLAVVVRDAIDTLAGPIGELDAKITVGALPVVHGHAIRLQSVFANLISNALRYREPTRQLEIVIDSEVEGETTIVRVADNGIGIDSGDTARLFRLFERSPQAVGIEGSGIGLSLSRRIAESLGATIGVDQADAGGSVFWIRFPRTNSSG